MRCKSRWRRCSSVSTMRRPGSMPPVWRRPRTSQRAAGGRTHHQLISSVRRERPSSIVRPESDSAKRISPAQPSTSPSCGQQPLHRPGGSSRSSSIAGRSARGSLCVVSATSPPKNSFARARARGFGASEVNGGTMRDVVSPLEPTRPHSCAATAATAGISSKRTTAARPHARPRFTGPPPMDKVRPENRERAHAGDYRAPHLRCPGLSRGPVALQDIILSSN